MDCKTTIYISLIFTAMFVGQFIPFKQILGAPLSLILLAYFEPYLSKKVALAIFTILGAFFAFVFNIEFTAAIIGLNEKYMLTFVGYCPFWFPLTWSVLQMYSGYLLVFAVASKIIKKTKIRERFPLSSFSY